MSYPVALSKISRRTFAKLCASFFAVAPMPAASGPQQARSTDAFKISLELNSLGRPNGSHLFIIRISNLAAVPVRLKSIQLFAPGESSPRKACFDAAGGDVRPSYSGQLNLESSQYVMALAEFDDGTLIHDRRFVRLTTA